MVMSGAPAGQWAVPGQVGVPTGSLARRVFLAFEMANVAKASKTCSSSPSGQQTRKPGPS